MNNWKVILATMVIFGAGVVTGTLLIQRVAPPLETPPSKGQGPRPYPSNLYAGLMRTEFLRRAQRELDLTPQQKERVDRVIRESQERSRKLMEPVAPQLREELNRARTEFRAVLTPQQATRFDELAKQQQQRPREGRPFRERMPESSRPRGTQIPPATE